MYHLCSIIYIILCWTFVRTLREEGNDTDVKPWRVSPPPEIERQYREQLYLQRLRQYLAQQQQREYREEPLNRYPERMILNSATQVPPITSTTTAVPPVNNSCLARPELLIAPLAPPEIDSKIPAFLTIFAYTLDVVLIFILAIFFRVYYIKNGKLGSGQQSPNSAKEIRLAGGQSIII